MSTTDKELLELAAKAAGIELIVWPNGMLIQADNKSDFARTISGEFNGNFPEQFNPLKFDHQAFRLALALDFTVQSLSSNRTIEVWHNQTLIFEPWGHDRYKCAATRRAIVRAAAEIGKNQN